MEEQWFRDRIGQIVYNTKEKCPCTYCDMVYNVGVHIRCENDVKYLTHKTQTTNLRFFESKDDREAYLIVETMKGLADE